MVFTAGFPLGNPSSISVFFTIMISHTASRYLLVPNLDVLDQMYVHLPNLNYVNTKTPPAGCGSYPFSSHPLPLSFPSIQLPSTRALSHSIPTPSTPSTHRLARAHTNRAYQQTNPPRPFPALASIITTSSHRPITLHTSQSRHRSRLK